jgi:Undecaprenyl-phosphate galactose phosphotransferase WbaP
VKGLKNFAGALVLLVGDALSVGASYALAYLLRSSVLTAFLPAAFQFSNVAERFYLLGIYLLVFAYEGLYAKRFAEWEETRRCFRGMVVATSAVMMLPFVLRYLILSRVIVLLALLIGIALVPAVRILLRRLLVAVGLMARPLVLLGNRRAAALLDREIARHGSIGYVVREHLEWPKDGENLDQLLERLKKHGGVGTLVVHSDSLDPSELRTVFQASERWFPDVMVIPNESLLRVQAVEMEPLGGLLVLKYSGTLLRPVNVFAKRVLELAVVLILMALLAPVYGAAALLVRLTSRGSVFFRQQRIGRNGRLFKCMKFRTMRADAEVSLPKLLAEDGRIRAEWTRYARITGDPRVTAIGSILRRLSIDELPQLWNVLRGEMALVGPRPYLPSEKDQIGQYIDVITRVRPGVTGLWQVSGRAALPFEERLILDEFYIRNWSLWMDLSIVLRTTWAVLSGRGAY